MPVTFGERFPFGIAAATFAAMLASAPGALAQASMAGKPLPGVPVSTPAEPHKAASLLDEPASSAKIRIDAGRLSIQAANSSLTDVIRQVAAQTGMQVEGNSRDQRVFGVYGPGSPPEVLSALLYDSGYNVMMVGRMADGAPRRLVLSARTVSSTAPSANTQNARNDDDDETADTPVENAQPVPMQSPGLQPAPAPPGAPGQVKTPQQMLEELQRMHAGQQPQEIPRE